MFAILTASMLIISLNTNILALNASVCNGCIVHEVHEDGEHGDLSHENLTEVTAQDVPFLCGLGFHNKETTYGNGGACYVEYNKRNGTNYQCYITLVKKVTCTRCGRQLSYEELERNYGACLWASVYH